MWCNISYNKDKYGQLVQKSLTDVISIQEVPDSGLIRFVIDSDGRKIYKEFKLNDTFKIEVSFEDY